MKPMYQHLENELRQAQSLRSRLLQELDLLEFSDDDRIIEEIRVLQDDAFRYRGLLR